MEDAVRDLHRIDQRPPVSEPVWAAHAVGSARGLQERLSVLAAPRMVRSTFLFARLRSAVPKHA